MEFGAPHFFSASECWRRTSDYHASHSTSCPFGFLVNGPVVLEFPAVHQLRLNWTVDSHRNDWASSLLVSSMFEILTEDAVFDQRFKPPVSFSVHAFPATPCFFFFTNDLALYYHHSIVAAHDFQSPISASAAGLHVACPSSLLSCVGFVIYRVTL